MSDTLEDRQRQREIRGSVLRTLDVVYGRAPDACSFRSIQRVVQRATERELEQAIQFLIDLSYAARVQEPRDALDKDAPKLYRLTAQGKRMLNGDVEDHSIEL